LCLYLTISFFSIFLKHLLMNLFSFHGIGLVTLHVSTFKILLHFIYSTFKIIK